MPAGTSFRQYLTLGLLGTAAIHDRISRSRFSGERQGLHYGPRWSLLGLWGMLLSAQIRQRANGPEEGQLRVARVLKAFRQAIDEPQSRPEKGQSLNPRLRVAAVDSYQRRDKSSRAYPRKKYETQAKPPRILAATRTQRQRQRAMQLILKRTQKALTA